MLFYLYLAHSNTFSDTHGTLILVFGHVWKSLPRLQGKICDSTGSQFSCFGVIHLCTKFHANFCLKCNNRYSTVNYNALVVFGEPHWSDVM